MTMLQQTKQPPQFDMKMEEELIYFQPHSIAVLTQKFSVGFFFTAKAH